MNRSRLNLVDSYNLDNFFGFGDDDIDLTIWNDSSVLNSTMAPVEFQENKPYRLALYVGPRGRRNNIRNAFAVMRNANQKLNQKKQDSKVGSSVKNASQVKSRKNFKKVNGVMLFDENIDPGNDTKKQGTTSGQTTLDDYNILKCVNSSKKNVLTEVNCKPMTKTKQYKVRKSYERKYKEKDETEVMPEKPSDEIIRELEMKRLTKTKPKKPAKEDKEFEKWASDVNSDFNDVDKFELSIAYD